MSTPEDKKTALSGRRVLVVEDDYFQATEMARTLERAGAEVIGPTASVEAISVMIDTEWIDSAVVDINLGSGTTFGIARSLRAANVPFVFVTGYDPSTAPDDMAEESWLTKPVDNDRLIVVVEQLESGRPAR